MFRDLIVAIKEAARIYRNLRQRRQRLFASRNNIPF